MTPEPEYTLEPIPPMRRFAIDSGYLGRRRHIVHGLLEVDVTLARQRIHDYAARTGEKLSFTTWIVSCLGQAIQQHPHLHAYRDWRNRLVIFRDVNISVMVEAELEGRKAPMVYVFKDVNRKPLVELHAELRQAQHHPQATGERNFMRWFLRLPAFLRHAFYAVVMRFPASFRAYSAPVLVTAVGMFGNRGGWAITLPNFTLSVVVGGITRKPGVYQDQIAIREYLNLTLSIDHDIVDGAPAARFAACLQDLLEAASGLPAGPGAAGPG
jgi:hypothetical protein